MTKSRGINRARCFWTEAELDLLRSMYPECHTEDVGTWIGRTITQCYQAAAKHGLHKSAEYLASDTAARIKRGKEHPSMIATRFKAGHDTWNRGLKGVAGVQEACRATQFKKGHKPHTTLPIGSYRINPDGHLQRKVSDAAGSNSMRWRNVAELVWVQANGPIPPKHFVVFKPGLRTAKLEEITLDRVECISLAENARRNHPRTKSPELAALVQLKGAITRQVNRISREAAERQAA